jgi:hypothetical protein
MFQISVPNKTIQGKKTSILFLKLSKCNDYEHQNTQ